ncbi:LysR family transcriptional regulator [Enterococcus hulanensis]|uniref:LysR family transcriptional regulator n=1 Tax=Enterococcus hulanensis TaxID=2559929 RepID=UPI001A8EE971|nr:LysR family transcriptional regulator [Enterococcus hulanensis]MBO0457055.1 LysR family transcriptional regulator [Enterococcus hulanensis]
MDMNIQKYMAFVKTVELGSFTKAAKIMNYSQSGISRMINDLEQEWGITLLERNRAGLRLTSDGMNILPYAKELAEKYQTLQNQLAELGHLDTGLIRIGTFSSVATHWLPEMIQHFQADYPNIDFELLLGDYEEIEQWIIDGRVDFGFSRLPAAHDLDQQFLHADEQLVVLPQGHPLLAKEKINVTDLEAQPFILLEREGTSDITELLADAQVQPQIKFRTWDDYSILAMVEKNLGISILPKLILQRIAYRVETRPLVDPVFRKVGILYRNKTLLSLASKEFLKIIPTS